MMKFLMCVAISDECVKPHRHIHFTHLNSVVQDFIQYNSQLMLQLVQHRQHLCFSYIYGLY